MLSLDLEKYLHNHIPISKTMGISVISVREEDVILSAPLAPNINHRDTAFGGSVSALAILAAWSLLHTRLQKAGNSSRLVIQRSTMDYHLPILGEFTARSFMAHPDSWQRFVTMLDRKGKARISASASIEFNGQIAGSFVGEFVALMSDVA